MRRPDDRPLRRLPQLESRKATLERCVFCPKLCRTACPVSNAEPRETLTPWGKMSFAYFAGTGSVPLEDSYARPAWACTGCHACRSACDHKNDVAGTLLDTRSALVEAGIVPDSVRHTLERFHARAHVLLEHAQDARLSSITDVHSPIAVLVGCEHIRRKHAAATDLPVAVSTLLEERVSLLTMCCGAPLLHAGDAEGFAQHAGHFAASLRGKARVVSGDAGCTATLRVHYAQVGVSLPAPVEHFSEFAMGHLDGLVPKTPLAHPVRWHDPCQLGRGLGVYEAPRQVLARALGKAPEEFVENRENAHCSGGGALLPITMPRTARDIATERLREHEHAGGGTLVTACASSETMFRKAGQDAVLDLSTVVLSVIHRRL
jgi:Fe-S oxidoreductase